MNKHYLEVAHSLGRLLAKTAVWHQDRCNWVGARPLGGSHQRASATLAALGPDLYSGTSGIALFLAELHAATGDTVVRHTALGAIRQALSRVADVTTTTIGSGLYEGRLGIAVAAAQVGTRLGEGHLLDHAATLAKGPQRPDAGQEEDAGFDLISGRAGSVIGLLVLRELLDDHSLLEKAVALADELLAMARKDERWYSWSPALAASTRPLTGLSHGAAGVGYSLLELSSQTDDARYWRAAELAFAYERSLFDPVEENWPDLRQEPGQRSRRAAPSFATQWCHGAPGVALSRLRSYHLYDDETSRVEAVAGIATTRKMVANSLSARRGNYSLCHGLAGNAEVLLHAEEMLGSGWAQDRALAMRVAEDGMERFSGPERSWPCGVQDGVTPNLMVGLAGVGHFYLRLYDPMVPSALLLRPEAFKA